MASNELTEARLSQGGCWRAGKQKISDEERRMVLYEFNDTEVDDARGVLVHELIEEQVRRTPNAVALEYQGRCLTYLGLNRQANQVARLLRRRGIGPDHLVGLCFERCPEMIVALLGILKAGGAYVPLDPSYPARRLARLLADAAPDLVLTQQHLRAALPEVLQGVITLDTAWKEIARTEDSNLDCRAIGLTNGNLAYVIYTSGSTGAPNGVAAEHRNMVNRIFAQSGIAPFSIDDVCFHKTTIGFVDAVFEILGPLSYGRPLVLASWSANADPLELAHLIRTSRVSRLVSVPSLAQALVESEEAVRCLEGVRGWTLSGEELRSELLEKLREAFPKCRFVNLYGSSEVAADATWYPAEGHEVGRVPIGRPIQNVRIYILDEQLDPVPIGVTGEIFVGGAGVARGYLNRAELTAERFLSDPFSGGSRAIVYRTGDRGRWRQDGIIEFLGRTDQQVKIRGFRIELAEIEAQLRGDPQIKDAAVTVRRDMGGDERLVAYLVPQDSAHPPLVQAVRSSLLEVLPVHMVPSAFVILSRLPMTLSGKLDRNALPSPDFSLSARDRYEAPRGFIEATLAGMWQDLLRIELVGRSDNFFELGGHSLYVMQMIQRLRGAGFVANARLIYESPTVADLAAALTGEVAAPAKAPQNAILLGCERITPEMLPLVTLEPEQIERIARGVSGGITNIQDIYPLTPLQQGMLFHHLLDSRGRESYVSSTLISLATRERVEDFIAALQRVIDRHDILRTAMLWEGLPQAVQVVYRQAVLPVEKMTAELDPLRQLDARMRFGDARLNIGQAPMLRLEIIEDPRTARWFGLLRIHHLISDEQSVESLFGELAAFLEGRMEELPAAIPFREHVFHILGDRQKNSSEEFFQGRLGDVSEPTAPFGLLDVRGDGREFEEAQLRLEGSLARLAYRLARQEGVSAATLFHAAWAFVVSRADGRDDPVYGTVLLGRMYASGGGERGLGMFINTLPLRISLEGLTARSLVKETQRELVQLQVHEHAALAEAQRCSGLRGSGPLFTALLNYRHSVPSADARSKNVNGIEVIGGYERTNYPVALIVDDLGDSFTLTAQTDRRIDPRRVLGYTQAALASLLEALKEKPDTSVHLLQVLPESERREVIEEFNRVQQYPKEQLIQELFEGQVRLHPRAVAVTYEGESLTYGELNARANQLAWYLREKGVGPDRLVGICVERGLEMVVGLLGILKAGGAYVPLDPGYPAERLAYMLEDAAPPVVLTQERLKGRLPASGATVVALDGDWDEIGKRASDDPAAETIGLRSDHLAYVIYTSGSTGRPKGVMVEHGNVVRLFAATESWFGFGERDVWTLFHSFAFDFSVWELWGALICGGRVVIVPHLTARSPQDFYQLLCREGVTVLNQTPSAFGQLIEAQGKYTDLKHALRVVIFGGEALEFRTLRPWVQRNGAQQPQLINMYGITETTVHVTYRRLSKEEIESERGSIIGRPIPDLKTYLLDRRGQPVPIGVAGEIYVGGAGVARGYLNRAQLTAERFLTDPFSTEPKARMYKTGDLGKWRSDGTLEYLGRNDEQVKIRGFRIELGEIEAQLVRHGEVREAVVVAREDAPGERRLVGYVIAKESVAAPSAESLREHLKAVLPEYMVPSAFVVLDALPLTPNGKLDRRALPAPDLSSYTSREYEAPVGEVEEVLAGIWQELLSVQRVGRTDNFFELGGHSLLGIKLIAGVEATLGCALPMSAVFRYPTLSEMGKAASSLRQIDPEPVVDTEEEYEDGVIPLYAPGSESVSGATKSF